ncbi:retropepsin-like aspartic protease [Olivibacter domesticus]|uniref:Aspartyl protease n=1 Tax=Olivibacter domesticus TaxID=407022 RepID=A0A1H7Y4U5_OLID1|nr:retropepsin-like aspartic protease [Olivibacter domesticus]SEM40904.1 Aspartyl protease [Olivibacter domesticus]
MIITCRILVAALLVFLGNVPQLIAQEKISARKALTALNQIFKYKNPAALKPLLSTDFSIAAYHMNATDGMLKQILKNYPADSIALISIQQKRDLTFVKIGFYNRNKLLDTNDMVLDKGGSILYLEQFDRLFGMDRSVIAKHRITIPFENDNGAIILKVTLNSHKRMVRLLFDTGADGMVLSKDLADSLGIVANKTKQVTVLGGHRQAYVSTENTVYLGKLALTGQRIALVNDYHKRTDGIIGNTLTKRFIVKVNYDKNELSLYDFGYYEPEENAIAIPVKVPGNILLPVELNIARRKNVRGSFFFDTGARYNLLVFPSFVVANNLLTNGFRPLYTSLVTSMGVTSTAFGGIASGLTLGSNLPLENIPINLMDTKNLDRNWKTIADGSIGARLIGRYNFVIDLLKKVIYLSPNHTFNYPQDFILGGLMMGFDHAGHLRVKFSISPSMRGKIKEEAIVERINGIASEDLLKDIKKLNKLLHLSKRKRLVLEAKDERNNLFSIRLMRQ